MGLNYKFSRVIGMDEVQADFALNLLKAATRGNESAIISPFSAAVALAMAYIGAVSKTKEEMSEVLAKGQYF
ncbi:unnamed protein product [Gongylonema pulchrum]|uniref:SERPIN domain-containing protein n=1 Tax=Gongylonema pulchrum TaxID=637853 RepID=A0A183D5D1_9BILA|nr:unnamed protein product [Gongylonema pulchrum]